MARRARRVLQVAPRVQLVLLPGKNRRVGKRMRAFICVHQKAIGVVIIVLASVVLVVVRQHQLAAVTFASVAERAVELLGEVLSDRLFPGGEFTKE